MGKAKTRVFLDLNTEALKKAAKVGTEEAMWEAGHTIAQGVRGRAKGSIADSVYVATTKRSTYQDKYEHEKERKPNEGEVTVAAASYVAHFHESGTIKMAARPFFRPGFDATRRQAAQVAADTLRESLERA
jgi:HK97 gp10 family phage protein